MPTSRARADAFAERSALPALLVLAAALRVREALRAPLWYDELYSRAAVDRPWADMLRVFRADVHPPLHFVLSWVWRALGDGDLAIRSLSLVCALVALALGFVLTRELFGRAAAALATLLLALHPWHVALSAEARSYPLLWCGLLLASLGAWRWTERGRRRDAVLFVLGAALALWTHYIAGLALAVQWAWGLWRLRREPKRLLAWLGLHAAAAALFVPVLPSFLTSLHRAGVQHWLPRPDLPELWKTLRRFTFSAAYASVPVLLLAAWAFRDARTRRAASFALAIGPLAVVAIWALGTAGPRVFGYRYVLFGLPGLFALCAAGTLRLPGRVTPALVSLALVLAAARGLVTDRPQIEAGALREVRARLASQVRPGDVIFHADTHTLLFGRRYFPQARHRLLLMGQPLFYYEGGEVVPDSLRGSAAEAIAARAAGARWFALAARPAGIDVRAAAALFDRLAPAPPETLGVVRLWTGAAAR